MGSRKLSEEGDCVKTTLRISPKLYESLENFCEERERHLAPTIREAIRQYLERWE